MVSIIIPTYCPVPEVDEKLWKCLHSIVECNDLSDVELVVVEQGRHVVMKALCGDEPQRIIVNTRNAGAIEGIDAEDIVEVPCSISRNTIAPQPCGSLPSEVRGLVFAVKEYERATIEAAMTGSMQMARKAMLLYPAIGEWEPSETLLRDLTMKP